MDALESTDRQGRAMIELEEGRRRQVIARLQRFFREELEQEMSGFRAEQTLDFFLAAIGPQIYNQAVQDARAFMQQRLDDLDGEVYRPEAV
jgi:uncharacterized protein (DUF2164 family)